MLPVKPVENTARILDRLSGFAVLRNPRVLVVGDGAAGCEVAANAASLMEDLALDRSVTVVASRTRSIPPGGKGDAARD